MKRPQKRASSGQQDASRGKPKVYFAESNKKRPWLVSWRHKGKRQRWTFETEAEANGKLDELENTIEHEGTEGVRFGAVARAEWNGANAILEPLGASVIEAARFYARHHSDRSGRITWEDAVHSYQEEMEATNKREVTIRGNKQRLKSFADYIHPKTLADLTRDNARDFLSRPAYSSGTVAAYRLALSGLANHAKRRGWMRENPIEHIPAPTLDKGNPVCYSVRDANAFLAAAAKLEDGRILKQIILRVLAGLRPNEAEQIQEADLLPDAIRVGFGKIRGRRSVRIVSHSPAFRAWWALAEEIKSPLHPRNFRKLHERALILAKVKTRGKDIARHTWISCVLATMHDENKVARMAGNSPTVIYSNYFQLIDEKEAAQLGAYSPLDSIKSN